MPNFETNPDLKLLGTETAFDFGAEVMAVEKTKKFLQIYKFHIGDTGPKTPEPIINTAIQALKDKQTKYAHFQGYLQVRANIAKHWTKTRGVEIKPENIIPGVKHFIKIVIDLIAKSGLTPPLSMEEVEEKVEKIKNKYF
ncbi:MAG: hypothetical protein HZC05_01805 [Candidatus Magasanikbacteria bacterium]|nr:hypothetical protein [Candidatus Magasanikbacteria bacterium]